MAIYFFYFLYALIVSFFSQFKKDNKKTLTLLLWLGLFLIMGLRSEEVGNDLIRYIRHYKDVPYIDIFKTSTEIGYMAFVKTLNFLGVGTQGYIIIISFIIATSFSWFFFKYSKNVALSFFLHLTIGLFSFSMTGIKQSIAISIILFALHYALKRKFFPFLILILLAVTFHSSAYVFFPVYFLCWFSFKSYRPVFFFLLSLFFVLILREYLFSFISSFAFFDYSVVYLESEEYKQMNILPVIFQFMLPVSVVLLWIFNKQNILKLSKENLIFFILTVISVIFTVMSLNLSIVDRLSYYFYPAFFILMPNTLHYIKIKPAKEIFKILLIFICIAYFLITVPEGVTKIDNYTFFWEF